MKRYDNRLDEAEDGEYVLFADHETALSEAYDRGMRDALAALGLEPDAD